MEYALLDGGMVGAILYREGSQLKKYYKMDGLEGIASVLYNEFSTIITEERNVVPFGFCKNDGRVKPYRFTAFDVKQGTIKVEFQKNEDGSYNVCMSILPGEENLLFENVETQFAHCKNKEKAALEDFFYKAMECVFQEYENALRELVEFLKANQKN